MTCFLSTETPFEATEVFQGSLSLRTHGGVYHTSLKQTSATVPSLNMVSRYSIPVLPSTGVTRSDCCLLGINFVAHVITSQQSC